MLMDGMLSQASSVEKDRATTAAKMRWKVVDALGMAIVWTSIERLAYGEDRFICGRNV
jgi:hypothetical protein